MFITPRKKFEKSKIIYKSVDDITRTNTGAEFSPEKVKRTKTLLNIKQFIIRIKQNYKRWRNKRLVRVKTHKYCISILLRC